MPDGWNFKGVVGEPVANGVAVTDDGLSWLAAPARYGGTGATSAHDGDIIAPMPGKVTSVEVAAGDKVVKGQRLLTLEAMKMEHGLTAPFDGTVEELNASAGAHVAVDSVLARIQAEA